MNSKQYTPNQLKKMAKAELQILAGFDSRPDNTLTKADLIQMILWAPSDDEENEDAVREFNEQFKQDAAVEEPTIEEPTVEVNQVEQRARENLPPPVPEFAIDDVFQHFFMKTVNGSRKQFTHTTELGEIWTIKLTPSGKFWQGSFGDLIFTSPTRRGLVNAICRRVAQQIYQMLDSLNLDWSEWDFETHCVRPSSK